MAREEYESGWRRRESGDFRFVEVNLQRNCPFPHLLLRRAHLFQISFYFSLTLSTFNFIRSTSSTTFIRSLTLPFPLSYSLIFYNKQNFRISYTIFRDRKYYILTLHYYLITIYYIY